MNRPDPFVKSHHTDSTRLRIEQIIRHLEIKFKPLSRDLKLAITVYYMLESEGHTALPLDVSGSLVLSQTEMSDEFNNEITGLSSQNLQNEIISLDSDVQFPFRILDGYFTSVRTLVMEQHIANFFLNRFSESARGKHDEISSFSVQPDSILHPMDDMQTNQAPYQVVQQLSSFGFSILTGGPGTGKTTAAAEILLRWIRSQMTHQSSEYLNNANQESSAIALAAPTGKAAARLLERVSELVKEMGISASEEAWIPKHATTLHRLLRPYQRSEVLPDPRREEKLPYALIIVDEASMLDLDIFHSLIRRLQDRTSLLLMGDQYQLESVLSGAVFRDLCTLDPYSDRYRVTLTQNWRFDQESGIAKLSDLMLSNEDDRMTKSSKHSPEAEAKTDVDSIKLIAPSELFKQSSYSDLHHRKFRRENLYGDQFYEHFMERFSRIDSLSKNEILKLWSEEVWLTPLRTTEFGSEFLNRQVEQKLVKNFLLKTENGWFHGKPFIVTLNNYAIGVFNGDKGVCCRNESGQLSLFVETSDGLMEVSIQTPIQVEPAWFLTVHKSQGSEYDRVFLLIPDEYHPLVHRQLLYTAVTRARKEFTLYGDLHLFDQACHTDQFRITTLQKSLIKQAFS